MPRSAQDVQRQPPQRNVGLLVNTSDQFERVVRRFLAVTMARTDNVLGALNGGAPMAVWRTAGNVLEFDFSSIVDPEGVLGAEIQSNGVRMIHDLPPPDGLQLPAGVDPALKPRHSSVGGL